MSESAKLTLIALLLTVVVLIVVGLVLDEGQLLSEPAPTPTAIESPVVTGQLILWYDEGGERVNVRRIVDEHENVVCYAIGSSDISCVPRR